ncbi:MAG: PDDEXK nuclease domain-containing protein [Burkholderiales bacterium]|nr:PDDEXK nuclease domain-containing protein [Burkholderiales bacterium]
MTVSSLSVQHSSDYKNWLGDLKNKFRQTQIKAHLAVNTALLEYYWQLGSDIVARQKYTAWGGGFLEQLSRDLSSEFPDVKGFSYRNLRSIRQWYLFWQQLVANLSEADRQQAIHKLFQLPWGHNLAVISKCRNIAEALFYVTNTVQYNWSRAVLTHQIESQLYERDGKSINNFSQTLPQPQSDLAKEIIKDPYKFDFLGLGSNFNEKQLEQALIDNISKFLLELGNGFAFVGKQKLLQVGERDFYLDLLFYHTKLHCYIVIELKTGEFQPEYAGKLNFYINALDAQIKTSDDKPTIGILLCKTKDSLVVEYSLRDINKPIGVAEYQLTHELSEEFRKSLPSVEELQAGLFGECL